MAARRAAGTRPAYAHVRVCFPRSHHQRPPMPHPPCPPAGAPPGCGSTTCRAVPGWWYPEPAQRPCLRVALHGRARQVAVSRRLFQPGPAETRKGCLTGSPPGSS
eukprot:365632-Chlamydomonas_euryale.AAC.30